MDRFKNHFRILTIVAIFTLAWSITSSRGLAAPGAAIQVAAVGTPFVYEGKLGTVTASYDLQFRLYNAATNGGLIGTGNPNTRLGIALTKGAYAVQLNFGPAAFDGSARWLEVRYKAAGQNVAYRVQAPRQAIVAVPYALGLRPGAQITGNSGDGTASLTASNTGAGVGLWGKSVSNAAVYGQSTNSTGVLGSGGFVGVRGRSTAGRGVVGDSVTNQGVYGETSAAHTASIAGVYGKSSGNGGIGVIGEARLGNTWGVYGATNDGAGVHGQADGTGVGVSGLSSGGVSGVYGEAARTGAAGVRGKATGGAGSAGVFGSSTAAVGVWGDSTHNVGVYGTSTSNHGVAGVAAGPNGAGIFGANSSGGYAMQAAGNATQSLGSGGWVKAMAFVDPFQAEDRIKQCYNSQLPAAQATSGDCGLTMTYRHGLYALDFNFSVADRFVSATPFATGNSNSGNVALEVAHEARFPNRVWIWVHYTSVNAFNNTAKPADAPFYVFIY